MASVNTNAAAITALRTLQSTNQQLDATQNRISTGLKIGEAKDNAAYWSISTTLKSDNKSLSTVKDALGLGSATVDVAYQGLNKTKDVLDEIKSKLVAATQPGIDRNVIQSEIAELQKQLVSIAGASVFSGENWLSVDSSATDYDATKKIVSSFSRDANNSVSIGTVDVAIGNVALFDKSAVAGKDGILDGMQNLKGSDGKDLKIGGTASTTGNNNSAGLGAPSATAGGLTGTGAGSIGTAAAASTPVVGTPGTPATPTKAVLSLGTWATSGATRAAANDVFTLGVNVDGAGAVTLTTAAIASNSIADMTTALTNAIAGTALDGKISFTNDGTTISINNLTANTNTGSTLAVTGFANSTDNARTGGLANGTATGTAGTAVKGATGNIAVTSTAGELSKLAVGDVITFKYKLDGVDATATATLDATGVPGGGATAASIATQLAALLDRSGSGAGKMAGVNVTAPASGNLKFESNTTPITGTPSTFELVDVTVKSSTATGGVIKNVDLLGGLTESKAGTYTTGDVSTGWTTNFGTTDTIKMDLTIDGASVVTGAVAAGGSLATFVNSLNADATFTAKATASATLGGTLVITSKTTGATSNVTINSTSFATSTGAAKDVVGSNFRNVASAGTATVGSVFPAAGITLDANDSISFNIAVDGGVAKTVTIDQALVNKTLTTTVPARTVTDGKMTDAADFKAVMDKALEAANITSVTTKLTGAGTNELSFVSKTVGSTSSVAITAAEASQGANQISVSGLDISDAGLSKLNVTSSDDVTKVLSAYITVVNNAINKVTTAAANLGAVASRIDMQKDFVNTLMDTIDKGVGNLIDADMSEESTKLQALQVKQQLGVQALSIANQSSQNILSLFR